MGRREGGGQGKDPFLGGSVFLLPPMFCHPSRTNLFASQHNGKSSMVVFLSWLLLFFYFSIFFSSFFGNSAWLKPVECG